ncbi:MAG: isopeptide-forming domain-containing fimbrial protein, partial [Anaerolineae bacterium]|nr:isopeptide-forming domain-containing fimbrial protein [Anaerolineae bacterium]
IPGTPLTYTINFQITQYDSINAAQITDTVPNGISTDYDSYTVTIGGTTYPIPNGAISRTNNTDGTITVVFNLEDATGISVPLPSASSGQIRYNGVVDVYYRDSAGNPDTDEPIRASDSMTNTVTGDFELTSGAIQSNTSSATVNIVPVTISKETLSVINPPENGTGYTHGEEVTFRLTMNIPSGDTRGVVFRDFLPLPVFDIDDPDLGLEAPAGPGPYTVPIQNSSNVCYQQFNLGDNNVNCGITWGPDATIFPQVQSFNINGATNSLEIVFDDINTSGPQVIQIDLTVAIIDNPFANGLFLSNQFESEVQNTPGVILPLDAISYLNLSAPRLDIVKGVVSSSNGTVTITPPPTGGAVDAGSDGDANDFDANDQVTYAITITNEGGAPAYDVVINDDTSSLAGLENCVISSVTTETGAALTYTGSLPTITLTSPVAPAGQAVVRLTCETTDTVSPNQSITNTATADYTGLPIGGYTYSTPPVPYPTVSDTANITMRNVEITKSVAPTSATIGETVTYTVTVTLPAGEIGNVQVQDALPADMAFVDCTSVTPSGSTAVVTNLVGGFAAACNAPTNPSVAGGGTTVTYDLGDISVSSPTGSADIRTVTIVYTAVVLDIPATEGLGGTTTNLTNTVTLS